MGLAISLAGSTLLTGCKQCDLVEAELRCRNRQVRMLQAQVCQKQAEIQTLQAQSPGGCCDAPGPFGKETPETIYRREAMSQVQLGLSTGPRDLDGDDQPDAVQFTVICKDYDGDAFKCPGTAQLELIPVGETGVCAAPFTWQVENERLREKYENSILGAGYQIVLPTDILSQSRSWKSVVKFTTLDGRSFQAEREFDLPKSARVAQSACPVCPVPPPAMEIRSVGFRDRTTNADTVSIPRARPMGADLIPASANGFGRPIPLNE